MPGYNHYIDCTCGWCDKSGFGYFDRASARSLYDSYSAKQFLKRSSADRGRAACFVNPNASCPECGAAVFFYANEAGSRVFFDDLGPPWPKHPCTDRTNIVRTQERPAPISRRARGLTSELVQAAIVALPVAKIGGDDWALAQVTRIERRGFRNNAECVLLESSSDLNAYFSFDSSEEVIAEGDIVALRALEMSIFVRQRAEAKKYKIERYLDTEFSIPDAT